jgi:hypothetical protein
MSVCGAARCQLVDSVAFNFNDSVTNTFIQSLGGAVSKTVLTYPITEMRLGEGGGREMGDPV